MNNEAAKLEFKQLTRPPNIAWPTVILFVACLSGLAGMSFLALTDRIPLAVACLLNGIIVYFLFSVVHDAAHRAVSEITWLNDGIGHIGLFFFGPLAPFNFARWIHMQHHRFANDAVKDPDHFGHKMDLFTPLRWLNFDYFYSKYFLEQAGEIRRKYAGRVIAQAILIVSLLCATAYYGYFLEALLLWIVPTRISSCLFVAMFIYLPHAPFTHTSVEDEYQASNIRAGWEWLLTPLMAYQNYHLAHHLYPRAPFYRMLTLWNAHLDEHLSNKPYFVKTFGVSARVEAE